MQRTTIIPHRYISNHHYHHILIIPVTINHDNQGHQDLHITIILLR